MREDNTSELEETPKMEELSGLVTLENPLDTLSKSVLRLLYENSEVSPSPPHAPKSAVCFVYRLIATCVLFAFSRIFGFSLLKS